MTDLQYMKDLNGGEFKISFDKHGFIKITDYGGYDTIEIRIEDFSKFIAYLNFTMSILIRGDYL